MFGQHPPSERVTKAIAARDQSDRNPEKRASHGASFLGAPGNEISKSTSRRKVATMGNKANSAVTPGKRGA